MSKLAPSPDDGVELAVRAEGHVARGVAAELVAAARPAAPSPGPVITQPRARLDRGQPGDPVLDDAAGDGRVASVAGAGQSSYCRAGRAPLRHHAAGAVARVLVVGVVDVDVGAAVRELRVDRDAGEAAVAVVVDVDVWRSAKLVEGRCPELAGRAVVVGGLDDAGLERDEGGAVRREVGRHGLGHPADHRLVGEAGRQRRAPPARRPPRGSVGGIDDGVLDVPAGLVVLRPRPQVADGSEAQRAPAHRTRDGRPRGAAA